MKAAAVTAFAAALQLWAVEGAITDAKLDRKVKRAAPILNTPSGLVTCEPTALTWTGGTAPFFVTIFPDGQSSGNSYVQFPEAQSSPIEWDVNVSAGTSVSAFIRDGSGETNSAAAVTITAGPDTSCVNVTGTSSGSSSGSSSSSSSVGSSGSSSVASSGSGSSATSSSSTPSSTPSTTTGAGAMVKAGSSTLLLGAVAAISYLF